MSSQRAEVVFLIANDRHHTGAALPVIAALRRSEQVSCRVVSLCEFRGFDSPVDRLREHGTPIDPLLPFRFRTPSAGRSGPQTAGRVGRSWLKDLLWRVLLAPSLRESMQSRPSLVVMPNDGAYPYDRICRLMAELEIPFMVLQEGIRFSTPLKSREGRSGASAWAVWGGTSADYFRSRGVPSPDIHVTGSPRFDELVARDWSREAAALRLQLANGKPIVTFLSNPIDDLGLVTRSEKLELIRLLVTAAVPLLDRRGWHLVVKLHGRESESEVKSALSGLPTAAPVSVVSDCALYPLLFAARGALTFASSVGLEALLCRVPLALVEVPGHGFVHDFVSSGAAKGITWDRAIPEQLYEWWQEGISQPAAVETYLSRNVANPGQASKQVALLIHRVISRI